jgi:hypothetical protein
MVARVIRKNTTTEFGYEKGYFVVVFDQRGATDELVEAVVIGGDGQDRDAVEVAQSPQLRRTQPDGGPVRLQFPQPQLRRKEAVEREQGLERNGLVLESQTKKTQKPW